MGGEPNGVRAELGKQKPRGCRTQELARSRAQEKCAAEKGRLIELREHQSCGAKPLCCRKRRNLFGWGAPAIGDWPSRFVHMAAHSALRRDGGLRSSHSICLRFFLRSM